MEAIQILFILGIITVIIFQYIAKAFKSSTSEVINSQPSNSQNTPKQTLNKQERPFIDVSAKRASLRDEGIRTTSSKDELLSKKGNNDKPKAAKRIISLDNIDEAKKAFIYSEIFNRKY